MLQEVFDKLEIRSRGKKSPSQTEAIRKRYQANGLLTARDLDAFEATTTTSATNNNIINNQFMSRGVGSGNSTIRELDQSENDAGYLSADEIEKGEDGILRSGRKKMAKARFAYREDPEYWTGRRGSNILKLGRRRSSMMYPQVKETAETAAIACSLMI